MPVKEGERPALGAVRRTQADLAFTVEKLRPCAAADVSVKARVPSSKSMLELGRVDGGAANRGRRRSGIEPTEWMRA